LYIEKTIGARGMANLALRIIARCCHLPGPYNPCSFFQVDFTSCI